MNVRHMDATDIEQHKNTIVNLIKYCLETTYCITEIEGFLLEKYESLLFHIHNKQAIVIGAFEDTTLCGFLWAYEIKNVSEQLIHIAYIAIVPEYRKQGLAKKLLYFLRAYIKDAGYKSVEIIVSEKNTLAKELYEKCGFVSDRVIMRLDIEDF